VRIRYTPTAGAELASLLDYIAQINPSGARNVHNRIQKVITLIAEYPYVGSRTNIPGTLYIQTTPYKYLVFYSIGDDEIIIESVIDGTSPPSWLPDED